MSWLRIWLIASTSQICRINTTAATMIMVTLRKVQRMRSEARYTCGWRTGGLLKLVIACLLPVRMPIRCCSRRSMSSVMRWSSLSSASKRMVIGILRTGDLVIVVLMVPCGITIWSIRISLIPMSVRMEASSTGRRSFPSIISWRSMNAVSFSCVITWRNQKSQMRKSRGPIWIIICRVAMKLVFARPTNSVIRV